MKTSFFIVAALTVFSSVMAVPVAEPFAEPAAEALAEALADPAADAFDNFDEPAVLEARGNLPTLNAVQSRNARDIIAEVKKEKLGLQGCKAGIATALTESAIKILANKSVPKSMKIKHDGVGSDHDSVGIFQQRAKYYKNIACDMNAKCSASLFFKNMKRIKGWKTMAVGKLCQKVQVSQFPTAYNKHVAAATKICKAGGVK